MSGQQQADNGDMSRRVAAVVAELRGAVERHKAGHIDEAVTVYRRILAEFPRHPDVHHWLGMAEFARGNAAAAVNSIRRAIALQPDNALFHANLGRIRLGTARWRDAVESFRAALQHGEPDAELLCLLARALRLDGEAQAALPFVQRALELQPESVRCALELAETLTASRHNTRAVEQYRKILTTAPGNAEALRGMAYTLRLLNRSDEALACLRNAVAVQPDDPKIRCELGEAQEETGDFAAARDSYGAALTVRGGYPVALARLLALDKGKAAPDLAAEAERHLEEQRIAKPVRVELHFALGRHYDGSGNTDAAFAHYHDANEIVAVGRRYRPGDAERRTTALIEVFTPKLFTAQSASGNAADRPVLIVGMPRSGTTLVEQILSSHRDVAGAGELGWFMQMSYELARDAQDSEGHCRWVRDLDGAELRRWADGYLSQLDSVSPDARRVIDKMPLNFLNLGLIALTLPKARVIHCRRDPLDNCFSCYIENMHQDQRYSTRLKSLGHFYRQYLRLMDHWRAVLPLPIIDVRYEDLVADLETQARRLVNFCGLEWDPDCVDFYRTDRTVTTPSKWQVRQPIYGSSVGRWRRYAAHLEPLREALGPELSASSPAAAATATSR